MKHLTLILTTTLILILIAAWQVIPKITAPNLQTKSEVQIQLPPIPTPTPTPIAFTKDSDLPAEGSKINIEDFTNDFKSLHQSADSL